MTPSRLFDLLPRLAQNFSKATMFISKEERKWINHSVEEFISNSNSISYGLMALGIGEGDKIATISNNRPEWNYIDMGMLQIGAIHVPVYPTISEEEFKFIFNDAEVKLVFVSDIDLYNKIQHIIKDCPSVKGVYTFNKIEDAKHWSEIKDLGIQNINANKLNEIKEGIDGNYLATIIYTSGTTGVPKGVMLSHANILSNIISCEHLPPIHSGEMALSFLPINHIFERTLVYVYIYLGITVCYAESIDKIGDNIREIHPNFFSAVPRLIEKVYARIIDKGKEQKGIKKILFFWAVNLGLRYEHDGANGWWYEFQLKIANKIIFNKWREALGGKLKGIVSGSAALQPRLQRIFWAARIPIIEGYGLTETSPVISVNTLEPGNCKFGTVGPVINGVEVKIADDGEILCKGPNVMMGYYKKPDLTAEVIDKDGYFHTGDIGTFEGKFLKITDRKKEIFKTSGGKYIAPQAIENKFKESPFIEQLMVIGENQRFPAALIVPSFNYVREWCKIKEIPALMTNEELIKKPEVIKRIQEEVDKMNEDFGHTEKIKKIELLPHEWTVDSSELTPTMKLKRKVIMEKNKKLIDKIYEE